MKWFNSLILMGVLTVTGWSQSVNWSPSKGTFQEGVQSRLSLVFKDCDPAGSLKLPEGEGLQIGRSHSRQTHMTSLSGILGGKGKTTTLGFPVVANQTGQVSIPAFKIATSEGELEVPAVQYQTH